MYDMLKNMDPPLGFGSKCPDRLAYKKLIRMNMPLDGEGKVNFTTTLFALIRENLNIKMRSAEEMDQADVELRETIVKVWPFTAKEKIEVLVPTTRGTKLKNFCFSFNFDACLFRHRKGQTDGGKDLRRTLNTRELEVVSIRQHSSAKGEL